jgi:hypothetical protein
VKIGLATVIAMAALTGLSAAGCGDDGQVATTPDGAPAAGENTPASATPDVPPGAPYDLDGRQWGKLPQADQFLAATAFINDNPDRCEGAEIGSVSFYVTNAYANDFPPGVAAAEVLAAGCDAALQG